MFSRTCDANHSLSGAQTPGSAPAAPNVFRPVPPQQHASLGADSDSDGDADEYVDTTEFTTSPSAPPAGLPQGGETRGGREGEREMYADREES